VTDEPAVTDLARKERARLCDLAAHLGPDQPTLCTGWTVRDLLVHLALREGSPAAVGMAVPALAGLTAAASRRLARQPFGSLVERVRTGPPRLSPVAVPKIDVLVNTLEMFVHHEDIRRAQPDWQPRVLTADEQGLLWRQVRRFGRRPLRTAPVGVVLERSDDGDRAELTQASSSVVVRGLPEELTMFVFGRKEHADVELLGSPADVAALRGASWGA
jgi:uncharacterized protein (TIGR03085 family)